MPFSVWACGFDGYVEALCALVVKEKVRNNATAKNCGFGDYGHWLSLQLGKAPF